jgi:hypothetical protein
LPVPQGKATQRGFALIRIKGTGNLMKTLLKHLPIYATSTLFVIHFKIFSRQVQILIWRKQ